jgi:hypothetical protein
LNHSSTLIDLRLFALQLKIVLEALTGGYAMSSNLKSILGNNLIITLLVTLIMVGTFACDDQNGKKRLTCDDVPARMDDPFFEQNEVTYMSVLEGDQIFETLSSELTPGGAFCTLVYEEGDLNGFGPGAITFEGEISDDGTTCDFIGTEATLVIQDETVEGMVDSGMARLAGEFELEDLFLDDLDAVFPIIGEFAQDIGCQCESVH